MSGLHTCTGTTICGISTLFIQSAELGHGTHCSRGFLLFGYIKLLSHSQTIIITMLEQYWDIVIP